jgi:hypothetical protein
MLQWGCNTRLHDAGVFGPGTTVVAREPLREIAEAYSDAALERVRLADGRRLVLKHLPPQGDWLTRVSGGTNRARCLWESGLLGRLAAVVDHTVLDVVDVEHHDVVVMRDASSELLAPKIPVSRATSRRLLAGLAALHDLGAREPVQPLCPIGARYGMFAPAVHAADPGPGAHPAAARIVAGWKLFAELADADAVAAVLSVHRDPEPLGRRLAGFGPTVVHGDVKLENLGLDRSRLVAVDWGDLTGFGPPEIDVGWYAVMNAMRIGVAPDELFADYEAAAGRPLDRDALDLVCIGSLAQMGFKLANVGVHAHRAEIRAAGTALLRWWSARVRDALDRVGAV